MALEPVVKGVEVTGIATSTLYPWESFTTPAIVDPNAGALILNTKT